MRTILLLLFLIACHTGLFSQNPNTFTLSENSFRIYRFGKHEPVSMNNHFVRELARINYLNPYRTSYSLEYHLDVSVKVTGTDLLEISSTFRIENVYGDIFFKEFNLAKVLSPTLYSFTLLISNDGKLVSVYEPVNLIAGDTSVTDFFVADAFSLKQSDFDLNGVLFSYDEKAVNRFNAYIAKIHQYLALHELAGYAIENAQSINPEENSNLLAMYLQFYDLRQFLDEIEARPADSLLDVPEQYDREFFLKKLTLKNDLERLRLFFKHAQNNQSVKFDDKTIAEAAEKLITIQRDYLETSRKTNHFYEPYYLDRASFFQSQSDWEKLLLDISATFGEDDFDGFAKDFARELITIYLSRATEYFEVEKFNEALLMLSSAEVICNSNPEIECSLEVFHNISKAKFGIFDSYLRIAESAMLVKNLDLARHYLSLARDFQLKNSGVIILPDEVNQLFEELAWQYFDEGRKASNAEEWQNAGELLNAAKEIYGMLNIPTFNEAIERELSKIVKHNRLFLQENLN